MLEDPQDGKRRRRKPNRMSDAEIIVILIHFHSGGFRCFNASCTTLSLDGLLAMRD